MSNHLLDKFISIHYTVIRFMPSKLMVSIFFMIICMDNILGKKFVHLHLLEGMCKTSIITPTDCLVFSHDNLSVKFIVF